MRAGALPGLLSALLTLGAAACATIGRPPRTPDPRPNIVLIVADDLGYGDLGCYGNTAIRTPNIDRLAREGVRLTDFSVAEPVCSASRAAILTGRYAVRTGVRGALGPDARRGLPQAEVTLAEELRDRGYATAAYGKWHLGHRAGELPNAQGFDTWQGLAFSNDMWPLHPETPNAYPALFWSGTDTAREEMENLQSQAQLTRRIGRLAADFFRLHRDRPSFTYVAFTMPHVPIAASEEFRGRSRGGAYGDAVEELDAAVGMILAQVDAAARADPARRTLVVFTSDNGPWLSYGNHAGSAGGLREGKGTTFEGGIRVPFVARMPGTIPAGAECAVPMAAIDLLPTLCAYAGADAPRAAVDGTDMRPALERCANPAPDRFVFTWYDGTEVQAVRQGTWKLHLPHGYRSLAGAAPGRDGVPAKYRYDLKTGIELYDLAADPAESRNVAGEHPEIVARLRAAAERANADVRRAP